jgi:hypothetical protein
MIPPGFIFRDNNDEKTLVAAGVVIALGIIWTGGAWYTGNSLKAVWVR